MSWRIAGFVSLLLAGVCAYVLYLYSANPIVASITTGVLSSIITGFLLVSVDNAVDSVKNKEVLRLPKIIDSLERRIERLQGIWCRIIQTASSVDDPNRFWLQERISEKECWRTLYIVGRSHRTVFVEISAELKEQVIRTIRSIISKGGTVKILILDGSDTLENIKSLFSETLNKTEKRRFHLHVLPTTFALHYSGLLNDHGLWMMPRLNEIAPDKACMFCVERSDAEYVYELYKTDLELTANKYPAVSL